MMLPTMMASRRVQVPDSHSGIRIPRQNQMQCHLVRGERRSSPQQPPSPRTSSGIWDTASHRSKSSGPSFCAFTFEPGSRFEQGLLECHVEVEVESFVFSNVISHSGKQDKVVEALSHALLQVRGKNPSRIGVSELQESLAVMVYSRGFIVRQGDIIS